MIFALLAMLILAALCIVIWGGTEDEVGVQAGLGAVGVAPSTVCRQFARWSGNGHEEVES